MKISQISIKNFKRFTELNILNIPADAKIILIVGPNGSGKSSLFDAFHAWYRNHMEPYAGQDILYYPKDRIQKFDYTNNIEIKFHDFAFNTLGDKREEIRGKFYFRTAYRNQADFTINSLTKLEDPTKASRLGNLIQNDVAVSENYQRLVSLTLQNLYDTKNDNMLVHELREKLIGKVRLSLQNIFPDLTLSSIGDPLHNGTFFFEKGDSKNFHYKNLSGGEKAGFDLILDLVIKTSYFQNAIYCIDEPETHMHTQLQASLFEEIYNLVPSDSQLWINTHSLGILKKAKEIAKSEPEKIAFINFDNQDFDSSTVLYPTSIDKQIWEKSIKIALDDFSNLIVPSQIILCEGDILGRRNKNFDAEVYNKIFSNQYSDVIFVSIGSSNDIEDDKNITYLILKNVLKDTLITRLIDRDDRNDNEIEEYRQRNIKVLNRRHIESYLWDEEVLSKLCTYYNQVEKYDELKQIKNMRMEESNIRGNSKDDIKSASASIYNDLKKLFNLTKSGSSKEAFLKDIVCSLITPDLNIYKELEADIFK